MASVLPYRHTPNSLSATSDGRAAGRKSSLSSFPPSRSASAMSQSRTRPPSRSPNPPRAPRDRSSEGSSQTRSSLLSSQQSFVSATQEHVNGVQKQAKLKSQYPREGAENHVEYILVASFHVDRGPIMEHQYPGAISGDENMLAELMLPDQAHVRNQDWTIFFLHKDMSQQGHDDAASERGRRKKRKKESGPDEDPDESDGNEQSEAEENESESEGEEEEDEEAEGGEGPPLVYVLNLPLLLLALEEYFKTPVPETLETLYNAVNSMDLSLMPRLSVLERHILQSSDNKDMFVEKFGQMVQQRTLEEQEDGSTPGTTDSEPSAGNIRRTGDGDHVHAHSRFTIPRDTHEFETQVLYNNIRIPIKVPTAIAPETVGGFSLIKLIQTFSTPHSKDPQPFMLHSHLTTNGAYTHPIIVLVNAVLTQKRVIFLGHNCPSGEVAEAVLAACALASGGVLRGFTRHAFPYTDLTKIDDLLKVPGFIAGVTNPAFANHPEWWDLLCDLPTGRMKISNRIEPPQMTEGLLNFQQQNPAYANASNSSFTSTGTDATGDQAFIEDILRSIASRHGEAVIRAKWRGWVEKFTRIAAAFEESVYGASALYIGGEDADAGTGGISGHGYVWHDEGARQRELAGGVSRIEGWRNTRSYYSFIQDLAQLYTARPIKKLDLDHLHDRLRTQKLSTSDSASIYLALASHVHSYAEICQLLTATPESHAGLFYLSLGMFHPKQEVRIQTVELLERLQEHTAGRHYWNGLNRFAKLAFFRLKREAEAKDDSRETGETSRSVGIDGRVRGYGRAS
ncbi:MAG: hypothetical protein M1833_002902 [Piccolia ochrophora]|nr:MAG: hypothetical protein M1833_002902 [Piccolia ochrophora]